MRGKAKYKCVSEFAEDCWPSRADSDGVKIKLRAQVFQHGFNEIVLPHRDAAGEDEHVFPQAARDFLAKIVDAIGGVAEQNRFASGEAHLRGEGDAVAVANLKWAGLLIDRPPFVAGGGKGDARLTGAAL